jgi:hypothetical protein
LTDRLKKMFEPVRGLILRRDEDAIEYHIREFASRAGFEIMASAEGLSPSRPVPEALRIPFWRSFKVGEQNVLLDSYYEGALRALYEDIGRAFFRFSRENDEPQRIVLTKGLTLSISSAGREDQYNFRTELAFIKQEKR